MTPYPYWVPTPPTGGAGLRVTKNKKFFLFIMSSLFLIIDSLINIYFFIMQNIKFFLFYILTEAYTFSTNIGFHWLLLIVYYLFLIIYLYMRNYLKDLCSPPTSTSPRPAVLQGGEEKYDNGQSSLTVVNHPFLAKYNLFNFRSKYPVFFWLYMIVLLLNLWFIFFKAYCLGGFLYLFFNVLGHLFLLSNLLRLSKWFNKKPELVEHELKIKMDYFLFLFVFIVIPVYLWIYIDKTKSSDYTGRLFFWGIVCVIIYYVLQFIFMDKTEDKRVKFVVRLNLTMCIVCIISVLQRVISLEDINMLYYSIYLEPTTMLHLKSPQHILDTLIPAGPARPQDIDPELLNLRRAATNASLRRQSRFIEELVMNTNWAETLIENIFGPYDIQTTHTFNPNGRGTMIKSIYHRSQETPQEFVRYSFTPGIWSNIRTR